VPTFKVIIYYRRVFNVDVAQAPRVSDELLEKRDILNYNG